MTRRVWSLMRVALRRACAASADALSLSQVGGVIINRKSGGDFYQPLLFESRAKSRPPVDLFEQVGRRPQP